MNNEIKSGMYVTLLKVDLFLTMIPVPFQDYCRFEYLKVNKL